MSPVRALHRPAGRLSERALGLLVNNGGTGLSAVSVAYFLHVSTSSAEKVLRTLAKRGLAVRDGDPSGGADLYRSAPQEPSAPRATEEEH